ncbi:hypothetical protein N7536_008619 [Penicillium majusculum]|nr:hypothetical protein N7536_008619 [Penicillium majusculum]
MRRFPFIAPYSRQSFIQLVRWPSWSKAHGSGPPDPDGTQLSPCLARGVGSNPTLIILLASQVSHMELAGQVNM